LNAVDLGQEVVGSEPIVIGELGKVAADTVWQDDHHNISLLEPVILDGEKGGCHGRARATTNKEALFGD
jgi:hypothetical protein